MTLEIIDSIVELIGKHGNIRYSLAELKENLKEFLARDNFVAIQKDGELIGIILFNRNGDVAEVEEAVIHPFFRGKGLIRYMTILGIMKFPEVKKIQFCRERKLHNKKPHYIDIGKFLKGRK